MTRAPYNGTSRKLVLAFDIGTTYGGAAYAFLDPGEVPQIKTVSKYLDNPNIGSSKVPSILYYDQNGNFRGVENGTGLQDDESLIQMRWWKLMLGPTVPPANLRNQMSKDLPRGKTIINVFSDFMRYLFNSTKAMFVSSDQAGEYRWNSVVDNIELILTHPNDWVGPQQNQLRTAAVQAKIVPDTQEGHARVHFVTEGEASFNFCATHTNSGQNLKRGDKVLVVDAGGGTIDVSSYVVTEEAPIQVEESFQPNCLLQGGEFVTARAREMVSEKLRGSKFDTPEDIASFAQKFDEGLKRVFSDNSGVQYVKFGSPRDNDPQYGIKAGKLMLTGMQVAWFFEPSIQSIIDSVRGNFTEVLSTSPYAFLVGGFASSPWLASQLNRRLSDLGFKFFKPDTNTDKAVSVGAVSFHIDHFVKERFSKFTYGVPCRVLYNPLDPEHVARGHKSYVDVGGEKCLSGAFETILSKGTKVLESQEIKRSACSVSEGAPAGTISLEVIKYNGSKKEPRWMDIEPNKFETLFRVVADISGVPWTNNIERSGKPYFSRKIGVVLLVGRAELEAQICWIDSVTGDEKRKGATITYETESENS